MQLFMNVYVVAEVPVTYHIEALHLVLLNLVGVFIEKEHPLQIVPIKKQTQEYIEFGQI